MPGPMMSYNRAMPIRVLSTHLVNKIAAGEVIERPASVVKELVENSIDAGAGTIDVAIEDGGKRLIRVTDDGAGMSVEDLALAFTPHATSKIQAEDDLYSISTMGFRGEALASIASISHAHIRSRRKEDDAGAEIDNTDQSTGEPRPCASAPGTSLTIRDLFYNTPARRKFMRTAATEMGHVSEQIARIALPNPQVAFTLTHNGRSIHNLPPAQSTRQRVKDLFGQQVCDELLSIVQRPTGIAVAGLISSPMSLRASNRWQYCFLNGRYIRDRLIAHALKEAYRGMGDPNRWPAVLLFIEIDPAEVDVNVHPTKIEVRFRDSQRIHGEVLAALRQTLNQAPGPKLEDLENGESIRSGDAQIDSRRESIRKAMEDFFKSQPPPEPRLDFRSSKPRYESPQPGGDFHQTTPPTDEVSTPALEHRPVKYDATVEEPVQSPCDDVARDTGRFGGIMQVHDSYIVSSDQQGLVIVDQHALHERIIYNDLKTRIEQGGLEGQRMLLPSTITVRASEADLLTRHAEMLNRLGIEISQFGPDTVAIQQFPLMLANRGVRPEEFLRELLDRLGEDESTGPEHLLEDILEMMACKAAIKAGESMSEDEMRELLGKLGQADKSSACPHGRPTTLRLSIKDLHRQFKRL